jgi:hypothetical protein
MILMFLAWARNMAKTCSQISIIKILKYSCVGIQMTIPFVTIINTHNGMIYPNAKSYTSFENILREVKSSVFWKTKMYSPVIPQTLAALHLHIPFPSL